MGRCCFQSGVGAAWLRRLVLVVGLGMPGRGFAQTADFSFQHYTTDQGLSNDEITTILKDRQGFMWFGTKNGLNRFDGLRFRVFRRTGRPDGLPGNYITGLTLAPDGSIWVSTHRGLCRLDPLTERFEPIPLPTQHDREADNDFVSILVTDPKGFGWFAAVRNLYRIDLRTRKLTAFPVPAVSPSFFSVPYIDRKGRFWVLHGGAAYQFDPPSGRYSYLGGRDGRHSGTPITSIYEDRQGRILFPTFGKGLMQFDERSGSLIDLPDGSSVVMSLLEDRMPDGTRFFWAGGGPNGLFAFSPERRWYHYFRPDFRDAFSHNGGVADSFYKDPQTGLVWIGTERGLQKVDPYAVKFTRKWLPIPREANPYNQVGTVLQDRSDSSLYWIGVWGAGLFRWHRPSDTFTLIDHRRGLSNWDVHDLAQDRRGHLWIGLTGGLDEYDPQQNRWVRWRRFPGLALDKAPNCTVLFPDRDGLIWAGTPSSGLFLIDPENRMVRSWPLKAAGRPESPARVNKLDQDGLGRTWVLTSDGLFRIDRHSDRTEAVSLRSSDPRVQPTDRIQSTFRIDSKNRLWVSGIGFLAQADLDGNVRRVYTLENGLQADHIAGIGEDRTGTLWLSTDRWLHELNPQTGRFRYYRKTEGLFADRTNNRVCMDRSGEVFLGFSGAFNAFRPERLRRNAVPPPVVIPEVRIGGEEQKPLPGGEVRIEPDQNTFQIQFLALNYSQPEKNRYAYRLEGFDTGWIFTDNPTATYTNLEPGRYTFRVKAANNDGVWNEEGTALAFRVVPPYWKTWWFRLAGGLLVAAAGFGIYQYRERQRRRLEAIRNRIATDLHDDMGSTLSSIRIFSDVVQQQIGPVRPEAVPILERISTSATTLSESMQDIIWTIQTRYDSLEDVVTRMREFGLKLAEAKGIDFRMQVSDQFLSTRLDVEQRRNLYLIFKESINNAVKYAGCTAIEVHLVLDGRRLSMRIQDNGSGFDPATVRSGNGLPNLKKRAKEIRGELAVVSAPGRGTRIELTTRIT
ncbi:sensor histidine kinase [Larkinella soli]|uniref:sensor histidine kinase n=1 Tax=Larkinella soli TaxID=1770527 RepID=UPI0013E3922F|nr:two-component regulator propeller domain-containing protein [Larkinella soli]